MARATTRLAAASGAVLLALVLGACNGDGGGADGGSSNEPMEVEVGEEFTWNDFTVEEGWTLKPIERDAGIGETMTSPEVKGTVVNNSSETRVVLFEMVFSEDGDPIATVNCAAMELVEGQSSTFECPGFGQPMPLDHDTVTVQPLVRDNGKGDETTGA